MSNNVVKDNKCLVPLDIQEQLATLKLEILNLAFPVGQPYVTQTDTNPSTILGFGTWERVKGKVLVGLDEDDTDFNTIGKTGGEKTHTLTVGEMPSHKHTATADKHSHNVYSIDNGSDYFAGEISRATNGSQYGDSWGETNSVDINITVSNTGGGQAHNNLQPYEVVGYMWRRTA